MRILHTVVLLAAVALPARAQDLLTVRVSPGSPAFSFDSHPPYRSQVPKPETLLGQPIGTRHTMYHQQQQVLDAMVAAASDRARVEEIGRSVEGKVMRVLIISSPANIARLDRIREDLAGLADPRGTTAGEIEQILSRVPAVAMLSHSIHGNEPAGFEAAMMTAYTLLASEHPAIRQLLDSVVVIINPSQNPDGHERFAAWSNSVAVGTDEPAAVEQVEPWSIQGRFSHYRFDMNRDLLAMSHPETRATAAAVLRWHPQIYVDLHSTTPQYFFPPAAAPINANFPASTVDWLERFGRANGSAFDAFGWQYYVRDQFDLFYPGYWDSWPSLMGAIGMTFESDGGPELALRKADGTITTLREGIAHHYVASLATLIELGRHRSGRLRDYHRFFASAIEEAAGRPFRRVVIGPGSDPARTAEVIELLRFQGIEASRSAGPVTVPAARDYLGGTPSRRTFPAGSWVIDLAQPRGRLATALLEPSALVDTAFARRQLDRFGRNQERGESSPREWYEFYDVTAWSLPLSHGLDAVWTDAAVTFDRAAAEAAPAPAAPPAAARSAYLIPAGTRAGQALTLALLREGFNLGVAEDSLVVDGIGHPPGTVVARTVRNPDSLHARIAELAVSHGVPVVAASSAFADRGISGVGSGSVRPIFAPRVVVLAGDGVSQTSFGDVWFYLERELGHRIVPVDPRRFGSIELDRYNVVVLPEGSYTSTLGVSGLQRLRDWVRTGGVVIALGSAVGALEHSDVALRVAADRPDGGKEEKEGAGDGDNPFRSPSASGNSAAESVPGAIARARIDRSHWLGWGYRRDTLAVLVPGRFLPPTKGGENVVVFADRDPVISGFTWPGNTERFLPGSVWATVDAAGRGNVVAFAENPLFRAFWRGPAMMFTNAVLFGARR